MGNNKKWNIQNRKSKDINKCGQIKNKKKKKNPQTVTTLAIQNKTQ